MEGETGHDSDPIETGGARDWTLTMLRRLVSSKQRSSHCMHETLREAEVQEKTGMWILAVRKGDVWIRPRPNTTILRGDVLVASGYAEGEEDLERLASKGE